MDKRAIDRGEVHRAARKLVERGKYSEALVEYEKLNAAFPEDIATLWSIADVNLKMKKHVDAVAALDRASDIFARQGFYLKALANYRTIYRVVHPYVPHLEDRFGHFVQRIADIYAQLGPASLFSWDRGVQHKENDSSEPAVIDLLRKVIDLDPSSPLPYLNLAEALIRVGDVDAAIDRFGTAAEILFQMGLRDDMLRVVGRLAELGADARIARIAGGI